MIVSAFGFTIHLSLGKYLSGDYDPAMLAFYRSIVSVFWTLPFILRAGPSAFRTRKFGLLFLRSLLGTFGFLLGFYAISEQFGMPLSQFNAISFSRALFVIVLAALLLRETVGPRRWIATAVGFLGVLLMVRPDTGINVASLMALGAAISLAGAIVLVKTLSAFHSPLVLLTYSNVLSTILIGAFMLTPWGISGWSLPKTFGDGVLIASMALAGLIAQSCYITAMSKGEASFLSSMDYIRLPMTACVDWLIFQEFPGPFVWLGAAIIVASTLFIAIREAQESRVGRSEPPDSL